MAEQGDNIRRKYLELEDKPESEFEKRQRQYREAAEREKAAQKQQLAFELGCDRRAHQGILSRVMANARQAYS
jgi:hypothetical protein